MWRAGPQRRPACAYPPAEQRRWLGRPPKQVCATNNKACIVIRSLSDLAGGDADGNQARGGCCSGGGGRCLQGEGQRQRVVRIWQACQGRSPAHCSSSGPPQVGNFFGLASYHSSLVLTALVKAA